MSKKHVPAVAGVAIFAALAIALVVAVGGPLTAGAAYLDAGGDRHARRDRGQQTPATPITTTLSADPANDLTSATVDLHAGYIMDPYLLPVVGKGEIAASELVTGCNGYRRARRRTSSSTGRARPIR